MQDNATYWFPAKTYGWGWGIPQTWQGWVVLGTYAVLMVVGGLVLMPGYGPLIFVAYTAVLSTVLVAVCWIKGEPPSWRWGNE